VRSVLFGKDRRRSLLTKGRRTVEGQICLRQSRCVLFVLRKEGRRNKRAQRLPSVILKSCCRTCLYICQLNSATTSVLLFALLTSLTSTFTTHHHGFRAVVCANTSFCILWPERVPNPANYDLWPTTRPCVTTRCHIPRGTLPEAEHHG
jgi:hypothetical protein